MTLFVLGGGYAMIAVIEREFADKRKFFSRADMADIVVLAQSLPGIIPCNILIIVGYKVARLPGALVSILGLLLPSIAVLILVTLAYVSIITNKYVEAIMKGVRAGVIALLISVVIKMLRSSTRDICAIVIFVSAAGLLMLNYLGVLPWLSPIYIVLFGAAAGVMVSYFARKHNKMADGMAVAVSRAIYHDDGSVIAHGRIEPGEKAEPDAVQDEENAGAGNDDGAGGGI
ncbi:MAG: chromate transporter [Firmicutes bacterium]|nr:chromate transporter [Bacillota bacterium]